MADTGYYAPHETRMLALEIASEVCRANHRPERHYPIKAASVIAMAREFEAYLTGEPADGFEVDGALDAEGDGVDVLKTGDEP